MATVALFRLAEISSEVFAVDAAGNSGDLGGDPTSSPPLVIPDTVVGFTGRGRLFGEDIGLQGLESVADSLRLTRDFTVRAFVQYPIGAALNGEKSTIVARGRSGSAAERVLFAVEIQRVDASTARLLARWQEIGGAEAVVVGATFLPDPDEFFELAVVRRWIDTTTVELCFSVNDIMLGTEVVAAGDIGEGVGGTLTIGCVGDGAGDYERFLPAGAIVDQVAIESDAMSFEEIRQEFRRITIHQPNGYRILRSYIPPGETWSNDPSSAVQRWIASEGDGIGFALSQGEKLREDHLPDRAYGAALEAWEKLVGLSPKSLDTLEQRRAAVVGALRKVLGFTVDTLKTALEPLFGLTSAQIELFEFGAVRVDDFSVDDITTPPSKLWRDVPRIGLLSIVSERCHIEIPVGTPNGQWYTDPTGAGGAPSREVTVSAVDGGQPAEPYGATMVVDVDSAFVSGVNVLSGLFFRNPSGDAIFFGTHRGAFDLSSFTIIDGVRSAITVHETGGTGIDRIFMRYVGAGPLFEVGKIVAGVETIFSSTVAGPGELTPGDGKGIRWGGLAVVSRDVASNRQLSRFDNFEIFEPGTSRGYNFLAYRDPGLPGSYDIDRAQAQLDKQKPSHVHGVAGDQRYLKLGNLGRLGLDLLYPTD